MKKIMLVFLSIILAGCLVACGESSKKDRNDIIQYVKNELHLTDFEVSQNYTIQEGTIIDYPTEVWSITTKEGIQFYVANRFEDGLFGGNYQLRDDYENRRLVHQLQDFSKTHDTKLYTLTTEQYEYAWIPSIYGNFTNRAGIEKILNDLIDFQAYCISQNVTPQYMEINLIFEHPYKNVTSYINRDGDSSPIFIYDTSRHQYVTNDNKKQTLSEYKEIAISKYICASLHYDLHNDAFTAEEIRNAIDQTANRIYIRRKDHTLGSFDDLSGYNTNKISFFTLYELLKREGYDVTGTKNHYTVKYNGDTYEISSTFNDMVRSTSFEGEEQKGYYFLKNGEKMTKCENDSPAFYCSMIDNLFHLDTYCVLEIQ